MKLYHRQTQPKLFSKSRHQLFLTQLRPNEQTPLRDNKIVGVHHLLSLPNNFLYPTHKSTRLSRSERLYFQSSTSHLPSVQKNVILMFLAVTEAVAIQQRGQ